jgi:hypothetical protein
MLRFIVAYVVLALVIASLGSMALIGYQQENWGAVACFTTLMFVPAFILSLVVHEHYYEGRRRQSMIEIRNLYEKIDEGQQNHWRIQDLNPETVHPD